MIKAEKQVYHVKGSENLLVMAMDSDGFVFPVLFGATFDGYDENVIRISGGRIFAVGTGETRVFVHRNGLEGEFYVYAER